MHDIAKPHSRSRSKYVVEGNETTLSVLIPKGELYPPLLGSGREPSCLPHVCPTARVPPKTELGNGMVSRDLKVRWLGYKLGGELHVTGTGGHPDDIMFTR